MHAYIHEWIHKHGHTLTHIYTYIGWRLVYPYHLKGGKWIQLSSRSFHCWRCSKPSGIILDLSQNKARRSQSASSHSYPPSRVGPNRTRNPGATGIRDWSLIQNVFDTEKLNHLCMLRVESAVWYLTVKHLCILVLRWELSACFEVKWWLFRALNTADWTTPQGYRQHLSVGQRLQAGTGQGRTVCSRHQDAEKRW